MLYVFLALLPWLKHINQPQCMTQKNVFQLKVGLKHTIKAEIEVRLIV